MKTSAAAYAARPTCAAKNDAEIVMTPDEATENKKALDALCDESPEPVADRIAKFLAVVRAGKPSPCPVGQIYVAGACRMTRN